MRTLSRLARLAPLALAGALTLGCIEGEPIGPDLTIRQLVSRFATADGIVAVYDTSEVPPAANGGPALIMEFPPVVIVGGSSPISVSSSQPFSEIILAAEGFPGLWRLTLPAPTDTVTVVLSYAQEAPAPTFNLRAAGVNAGAVGAYASGLVNARVVGTGDVQISVAWDKLNDVDLWVFDPRGEQIYFANRESASGGRLDLDSNAACAIDDPIVNNENITWEYGTAPSGNYRVVVDLWAICTDDPNDHSRDTTNYIVTVHRVGQAPLFFTGRLTPDSTTHEIGTFAY